MKGKQLKLNAGGMSHIHDIPNKKYNPASNGRKKTFTPSIINLESRLGEINQQDTVDNDNIVNRILRLNNTQKALSRARDNLDKLGLKNFYRLAEFIHSETNEIREIEIYQVNFNTLNNIRKYLQKYFSKNIATDAKVYLESYEKENGKLQRINHLDLDKGRTMSKDDFPSEDGILKLHIQEGETDYKLKVSFKSLKSVGTNEKKYSIVIRPIFPKKTNSTSCSLTLF